MSRFIILLALVAVAYAGRHERHGRPPCGVPKFSDKLDDEKKAALTEIWKDYKEGDECDEQRDATRELISKFTDEERKAVFGERKHHGPHFLKGVSDEVREKFHALFKDHSVSREEKNKKFHELAEKELTGKNLEEFQKFEKEMEARKAEFEKKVAALSPAAKSLFDELQKLREQKRELLAKAAPEVRKEIDALFEGHHHGPRRGHHGDKRH